VNTHTGAYIHVDISRVSTYGCFHGGGESPQSYKLIFPKNFSNPTAWGMSLEAREKSRKSGGARKRNTAEVDRNEKENTVISSVATAKRFYCSH
jgi:hypothetical protein